MTNTVPPYLKLHRGDEKNADTQRPASSQRFWDAFTSATGWRVDDRHDSQVRVEPNGDASEGEIEAPAVIEENAIELASVAREMAGELEALRSSLRRSEMELAASVTSGIAPERAETAAKRVDEVLRMAITALGFHSAAIYMLDDDTQYLKTRAVVGLPEDRLSAEPRMLRGSRGDLEALVQEAVLIDDLTGIMGSSWSAPETAGAAICTALFRGDLPVGTMWFFCETPMQLGESHIAIAKMTSQLITLLLSEASRSRREEQGQTSRHALRDMNEWQHASLPVGNVLAEGWHVDGMIESPQPWAVGWHAWDVLPDGSIMIAIAEAVESGAAGALVAATARAAITAHCGYRHTPTQLMRRIGDTLWQSSTGEQLVSLLYARLDPETGEGEVACAGSLGSLIGSRYGYRPLIPTGTPPLASAIDVKANHSTFQLRHGETLLAYGSGLEQDGIGQELLGCCLRSASQSEANPLVIVRRETAAFPNRHERGLVSISRRG
ncbi:MAG: SpoIIE family protein phosphatase [Planctomycetota bacterium]